MSKADFKILTIDGGGSKGIYALGILFEIEKKLKSPLVDHFDAFYGTSTGAIIAAMLAKGKSVADIKKIYIEKIPTVMSAQNKSKQLKVVLEGEFKNEMADVFKKFVGIVATSMDEKTPKIFKSSIDAAHKTQSSFVPFFGCSVVDALMASCSAVPFFERAYLRNDEMQFSLIDGGFCANNPTLFAIIDALKSFKKNPHDVVVINVGTGEFPKKETLHEKIINLLPLAPARFFMDMLEISSNTTAFITKALFSENMKLLRISDPCTDPSLATNLLEKDPSKLEKLFLKGKTSFREKEDEFQKIFSGL